MTLPNGSGPTRSDACSPLRRAIAAAGIAALAVSFAHGSASAQTATGTSQKNECAQPAQTAETPPATGASSGTAPGSEGSTGWTGGTGGSYTGTTPQAPTPGSPTAQPETVTGLDPKVGAKPTC